MYPTLKLTLAAALAAGAVLATAPASAATRSHVKYRDLDLASAQGQAMLDRRLRHASSRVCYTAPAMLAEMMACREEAVSRARADLANALGSASPTLLR